MMLLCRIPKGMFPETLMKQTLYRQEKLVYWNQMNIKVISMVSPLLYDLFKGLLIRYFRQEELVMEIGKPAFTIFSNWRTQKDLFLVLAT